MLVERAGLIAKAEISVARVARHVMTNETVTLAPLVRVRRPIGRERRSASRPTQAERRKVDAKLELARDEANFAGVFRHREARARKARNVEAVAAFPRCVDTARRHHPCAGLLEGAVVQKEHTDQIVGQHEYPALPTVYEVKAKRAIDTTSIRGMAEWTHGLKLR